MKIRENGWLMFCRNCGTEIGDGSVFCPKCGTKVVDEGESAPASGAVQPAKKSRAPIIAIIVALVVIVAGVAGGLLWKADQDKKAAEQAEWDRQHAPQSVVFEITAPGLDADATPVPVKITGTDLDGVAIDEVQYLQSAGEGVEVAQGSYDFSFPGGYIMGDGRVAQAPETTLHADIALDDVAIDDEDAVEYVEIPALEVTDELIAEIEEWAAAAPDGADKAKDLADEAREVRDAAVAEEARKAAEAEAARVQARKDAIEATAREYISRAYDVNSVSAETAQSRGNFTDLYSPQAELANGWGWIGGVLKSIDTFEVVDEDTVHFVISYYPGPRDHLSSSAETRDGTLTFDENALILTGAIGMLK